jgi:hypothetical protein
VAIRTGGASRFPAPTPARGGGGPSQAPYAGLESLLDMMGPQYKAEFELEKANAIIDALMQGQKQNQAPKAASGGGGGGAGMSAPQAPQPPGMGQPMLSPMFYRMFNTAPESMQRLTNSIIGARRRPTGMI